MGCGAAPGQTDSAGIPQKGGLKANIPLEWTLPRPRRSRPGHATPLTVRGAEARPGSGALEQKAGGLDPGAYRHGEQWPDREVPGDGLPAPQVARPASPRNLGGIFVFSVGVQFRYRLGMEEQAQEGTGGLGTLNLRAMGIPMPGKSTEVRREAGSLGSWVSICRRPWSFWPNVLFWKYQTSENGTVNDCALQLTLHSLCIGLSWRLSGKEAACHYRRKD